MTPKIIILALVFFAMVSMTSAINDPTAALKDAANAPIAVENNNIIGTINGAYENGAVAAAPVGGPISGNTFPNISLPPAPNGATTSTPNFATIAKTVVSASIAGSFFF
ncbi:hypothetical protein HAX54_035923 [Datura stramonium]|uniref:Uncharacterized protein n=1 Tax=Datura stramonium TaxID=4076 RepID=A0ABS8VG26_DATST|nr:hypothetical protein [Datura stramonium]